MHTKLQKMAIKQVNALLSESQELSVAKHQDIGSVFNHGSPMNELHQKLNLIKEWMEALEDDLTQKNNQAEVSHAK